MTDIELVKELKINNPGRLTFQLEALPQLFPNSELVLTTLLHYMNHERPVVREGALYGLIIMMETTGKPEIMARIRQASENDFSPTIRKIADEYLYEVDL